PYIINDITKPAIFQTKSNFWHRLVDKNKEFVLKLLKQQKILKFLLKEMGKCPATAEAAY
ncbi:MAG: hypothetical protein LUE88_03495, partial [Clostridiales bacterium]|nr:hypothetical protein [Clostridiales bacterium]